LLQSEKLASIGLLAAGVAHEINNPIGYVNSNLSTLKTYLSGLFSVIDAYEKAEIDLAGSTQAFSRVDSLKALVDLPYLKSDTPALMDESLGGLERVKKIVQSLLDFSHVDADDTWRLEDIHEGIESTLRVVSSELKNKCEIVREYGNMPPVECLISSLSQVFANLLTNAAHAIEEHGVVTIRTGSQVDKAWVEIADTGKGIAPEHLAHIFDPFFTTKPVGKGTGMGLSVSYSIVQRHHGLFDVTSEVGSGTTFRLWLPLKQPTWPAPVKASKT
jgi:signal transduction histidine kinase